MKKTIHIIALLFITWSGIVAQNPSHTPGDGTEQDYQPGTIEKALDYLSQNMVRVEGGTYIKGPEFVSTSVNTFYCCRFETVQYLWEVVMNKNNMPSGNGDPMAPVTDVSWDDCQLFVQKLNQLSGRHYRLLTVAEWQYAARGGNLSKGYKYAGSDDIDEVAWYFENSGFVKHRSGLKKANELGLYDMCGNVGEWCLDAIGEDRAYMGSSFYSAAANSTAINGHGLCEPTESSSTLGFRIAADITDYEPYIPTFSITVYMGGRNNVVSQDYDHIGYNAKDNTFLFPYESENGKTDYQAVDIKDVSFITRGLSELATQEGSSLENAILNYEGTAKGLATVLSENEHIAEAYTEDGQNVVVRYEGDSTVTVYPVNVTTDPFADENNSQGDNEGMARKRASTGEWPTTGKNGKVVVFNFFDGDDSHSGQNQLLLGMMDELSLHGYGIEYYCGDNFTRDELQRHVKASQNENNKYRAIIVMSEGMLMKNRSSRSFFVTGEQVTTPNKPVDSYKDKYGRTYHICQVTSLAGVNPNCLLYVGSCYAFDEDGILPRNTYVGWKGENAASQAHAALLVHRMLNNQWTLSNALERLWQNDPVTGTPIRYQNRKTDVSKLVSDSEHAADFEIGLRPTLSRPATDNVFTQKTILGNILWWYDLKGTWVGSQAAPANDEFYVRLVPLMRGKKSYEYKVRVDNDYSFSKGLSFSGDMSGIYDVQFGLHSGFTTKQIRANISPAFIYAKEFSTNALEALGESSTSNICLRNKDGLAVDTIHLKIDEVQTFTIDESPTGNYSSQGCDVAYARVDGMSYVVTARKEGHGEVKIFESETGMSSSYPVIVGSGQPDTKPYEPVSSSIAYEYDKLNRLVKVTTLNSVTTYTYDALGNRTQKTVTAEGPDESL